jgi:hypothetical protein
MKRIALALSLLGVAGTASAAIFVPSPLPMPDRPAPKISSVKTLSALHVIEAKQDPVPVVRRVPLAPHTASLLAPPPDSSGIQVPPLMAAPTEPVARAAPTKASIERNPEKVVRDLTSEGNCKGRTLTSIRVEPDGRIVVQC